MEKHGYSVKSASFHVLKKSIFLGICTENMMVLCLIKANILSTAKKPPYIVNYAILHILHDGSYHHAKDGVSTTIIQDLGEHELHIH